MNSNHNHFVGHDIAAGKDATQAFLQDSDGRVHSLGKVTDFKITKPAIQLRSAFQELGRTVRQTIPMIVNFDHSIRVLRQPFTRKQRLRHRELARRQPWTAVSFEIAPAQLEEAMAAVLQRKLRHGVGLQRNHQTHHLNGGG